MFRSLGAMALGHLDDETLSATLDNFDKFRRVQEDYQKLAEELSKRLYEGKDDKQKEAFFELVGKLEGSSEMEEKKAIEQMMKDSYAEFYETYKKQLAVLAKLFFKEIEIEITEVEKDAFVKGIVLGKKDAPIHEILAMFSPMFKKEEKVESDFSELDELLTL